MKRNILVDPYDTLYTNLMGLKETGIFNVESDKPFRVLVSSFNDHLVDLLPQQVVSNASIKPAKTVESHISHAKMPILIPDDRDTKCRRSHVDVHYIDKINKNLTDQREKHIGKDENPSTAITVNDPSDREGDIRKMPRKHENMWSGKLGEIE